MSVVIGVGIRQKRDPMAICVDEVERREVADRTETHFNVHHLERLALGTPYPRMVGRAVFVG